MVQKPKLRWRNDDLWIICPPRPAMGVLDRTGIHVVPYFLLKDVLKRLQPLKEARLE